MSEIKPMIEGLGSLQAPPPTLLAAPVQSSLADHKVQYQEQQKLPEKQERPDEIFRPVKDEELLQQPDVKFDVAKYYFDPTDINAPYSQQYSQDLNKFPPKKWKILTEQLRRTQKPYKIPQIITKRETTKPLSIPIIQELDREDEWDTPPPSPLELPEVVQMDMLEGEPSQLALPEDVRRQMIGPGLPKLLSIKAPHPYRRGKKVYKKAIEGIPIREAIAGPSHLVPVEPMDVTEYKVPPEKANWFLAPRKRKADEMVERSGAKLRRMVPRRVGRIQGKFGNVYVEPLSRPIIEEIFDERQALPTDQVEGRELVVRPVHRIVKKKNKKPKNIN